MVLVGESPAAHEIAAGRPFVGAAGRILDMALRAAGLDRSKLRVMNLIPTRAPADKFARHDLRDVAWGREKFYAELSALRNARVVVALGNNPLEWLSGLTGAKITNWRGSALDVGALRRHTPVGREDYLPLLAAHVPDQLHAYVILPTFHPAAVSRQFEWHPLLVNDLQRAAAVASDTPPTLHARTWHINDRAAVNALADLLSDPARTREHSGMIAVDTENVAWPFYVGLATEDDVYGFDFSDAYREPLTRIMQSPLVLKIAHNLNHDWTALYKGMGIRPAAPFVDTMGLSHALNNAMDKDLSPGLASRFTWWPYHKWLSLHDAVTYNGMDCIVTYDAYWPMIDALTAAGLINVANHDAALLSPLLDMQWRGFRIDVQRRAAAEGELSAERDAMTAALQDYVRPVVDTRIERFTKPHLWQQTRQCSCCGGGRVNSKHCAVCAGYTQWPERRGDYCTCCGDGHTTACTVAGECPVHGEEKLTVADMRYRLPACRVCGGSGKVQERLAFNPNSDDQKADLLYRGLGIRARSYKGKETVRVGQLEALAPDYPLVQKLVSYARLDAEYDTVRRLTPAADGLLHCVFDPFGTDSGRVASKSGLIEVGTNAMNIPKPARDMVVPRDGYVFLYPDMEQVEARAIAAQAQDAALIAAFNDPKTDMHTLVRDDMRLIGLSTFSRDQAKRLEYASFYGARPKQLAIELTDEAYRKAEGMPMSESQTTMAMQYLLSHRFAAIGSWQAAVGEELLRNRYVTSITGRRRYWLGYIYDKRTKSVQYEILKQAWSAIPQDIGAWVLADGLMTLWRTAWDEMRHGLIHVHDALLYEVHESIVDEMSRVVTDALTQTKWGMRFSAKVKIGADWKSAS